MWVIEESASYEYSYAMRNTGVETWPKRFFYGFVFVIGFFIQPNWFYMNFYSNPKFRDGANWVPSYAIYSAVSGALTALAIWAFIRFAKKFL
jgi:fatty acid desaturase